ncbi:hypothetical protein BD289DRAFT_436600 [Coniella lustricola]|uniref:Uncharacterized protein n=1 Tax=Coniella lustricola TaxID=2025994 RepID=A0A2T3A578_9PEZI|nr:hypothetical protein BD289DRAFT_436600 [Coniella lustricola]
MSSLNKSPAKTGHAKPKKPAFNPARAINDRDWRRKQIAQSANRASSVAGSPPPSSATARIPVISRPHSRCPNPKCTTPHIVEGTCQSCGSVAEEESNIVAEVQFGEASNGQAYAQGVNINFGEAGHRMDFQNGRRRVAGGGDGPNNIDTLRSGQECINAIVLKCQLPSRIADVAMAQFKHMQSRGFLRGRTTDRGAGAAVYWAVRSSGNTQTMLLDIADAISFDVFRLGRTFKKLLALLYNDPQKDCPFEPLFLEDIIKSMCSRLGFDLETEKVQQDAVRIVSRMDRDWINIGRKPAGVCGSAVMVAARMNNFRRTAEEVSYVAKTTTATLRLRLNEFAQVDSAKMSIANFRQDKEMIAAAHDPPAFYKQTEEYKQKKLRKKGTNKRKRAGTEAAAVEGEEQEQADDASERQQTAEPSPSESATQADSPSKRQKTAEVSTSASPSANGVLSQSQNSDPQTDADGFAIPALPSAALSESSTARPAVHDITQDDLIEADPDNEQDEEYALASKYGDVPLPGSELLDSLAAVDGFHQGARNVRKGRIQGSAMRDFVYAKEEEKWEAKELEEAEEIAKEIMDTESTMWKAAYKWSGKTKEELLAVSASMRPARYQGDGMIDAPEVAEDEFANDPEVINCLLTEEESRVKEQLWLNENKDWLRLQQEKEDKAKLAPPRKPRKNRRRPRIGEGQATPASSAGDAALATAKRLQVSSKFNYDALHKMLSGNRGPGSAPGSEIASRQTSRAGSALASSDEEGDDDDDGIHGEGDVDDEENGAVGEDHEGGYQRDEGDEYGGGYDEY